MEPATNNSISSRLLSISEEELARHPMVMKMMQRLEALEGKKNEGTVSKEALRAETNAKPPTDEISEQLPVEDDLVEQVPVAENVEAMQV